MATVTQGTRRRKPAGTPAPSRTRRAVIGGLAAAAGAAVSAPHLATAQGRSTTWKLQTSWPGGPGLAVFKKWCAGIAEKTGGELKFQGFGAREVVGEFQLYDAVRRGVLQAINTFTLYWAGRTVAAVFLTSYPLGLRTKDEWDFFFYGLGGLEAARGIFAKFGVHYLGPVRHGPNILHSKVPIRSIEDFRGRRMRLPGGMVPEVFQAAGAKTTLLPGSEIFPALEKGVIDMADYVGPGYNYALGFHKVTKYISLGPPGLMSIYQPVDLMDFTVSNKAWNALSPGMKRFMEAEILVYSQMHDAAIQKADQAAWRKFKEAGVVITRLAEEDIYAFTRLAVPRWYAWANKDRDAARIFKIQRDYMLSGSLGYITDDLIKGQRLKF